MEHHWSEQPPTYQHAVQDTPDRANLMAMSPSQLARLEAVEDFEHRRELRSIEKKLRALELRNAESRRASIAAAGTATSMTSNYSAQMDEATTKLNKYLDIIIKFLAVEYAADSVPQVTEKNKQMFEFRSNVWHTIESSFSFTKDASSDMHVQRLRWLLCHILLVDYGITKPQSRDTEARAAISDMTKALQKYQPGQSLDDAYETDRCTSHTIRKDHLHCMKLANTSNPRSRPKYSSTRPRTKPAPQTRRNLPPPPLPPPSQHRNILGSQRPRGSSLQALLRLIPFVHSVQHCIPGEI